MTRDRRKLIDEIYTHALELPADERERYVRELRDDEGVRAEVLGLLAAATSDRLDLRLGSIRERLLGEVITENPVEDDRLPGQRIGPWLVGDRLARGGLATVYLAKRDDGEYEQRVAFKVMRRGLDTEDLVARFRTERQILSTLDHPGIARILDGGALPDGRPFLVLEFVDGTPITEYCKRGAIDVNGRVQLIVQVLQALHHAHRHLVVHRDIKPSNILVSSEGRVALLDFGIAKLLDPAAMPGSAALTRTGMSLLTPGYGSPEQRAGESVTTASDIYQVGVLLFELLTGERPAPTADELLPSAPSRHLKGTREYNQVRGDLDAIVLKAMHVEPGRRYGSASEMVSDLERYLEGRPVVAQPDTLAYRLKKLHSRQPWLFPVIGVFVLGIAAYIVTLTLYSEQLRLEQQRAQAAQDFMVQLVSSPDPFSPADPERGRDITVLEALDIGSKRLETELADQPELRAALLASVASVYRSLDQTEPAIELAEQALALNLKLYGEAAPSSLDTMRMLGELYGTEDDNARAGEYIERQLAIARKAFAADDPRLGLAEIAAGDFRKAQGDLNAGLELLEGGIDKLRPEREKYADPFIRAIVSTVDQDGMDDAPALQEPLEEALAVAESVHGPGSLYSASVLLAIARNAIHLGDYERAKANYSVGLKIYDTQLGPQHTSSISHMNNYGFMLMSIGDYAGAEKIHRELLDRLIESRGENHRLVADNYQNLASAILRQGRYDEALPLHRKAYEIYDKVLDEDHYIAVFPLLSIAYIELQRDNAVAAESAARTALETFKAAVPGSYLEGVAMCFVGVARERQGDLATGSAMVEASHALIDERNLAGSPYAKLCRLPED